MERNWPGGAVVVDPKAGVEGDRYGLDRQVWPYAWLPGFIWRVSLVVKGFVPRFDRPGRMRLVTKAIDHVLGDEGFYLFAFVYLPYRVELLVGREAFAPIDAVEVRIKLRISHPLGRVLRGGGRPRGDTKFWEPNQHRIARFIEHRETSGEIAALHRWPAVRGYCDHPDRWYWSSYREYQCDLPAATRVGIPRLWPLRPDDRRPWDEPRPDPSPKSAKPPRMDAILGCGCPLTLPNEEEPW